MSPAGLPSYSDEQLENIAVTFLKERVGEEVPIPVDVEWLTETLEGVDFDCYPALRANYGVEGGVWQDAATGKLCVCIDEDVMDDDSARGAARYRMAVAQALAHVLIHRPAVAPLDSPDKFRQFHNEMIGTAAERNTRRLASALLIPGAQLREEAKKVYRQLVQRVGTDNVPAVKKYLCSLLARQFQVSEGVMDRRLSEEPTNIAKQVEEAMRQGLSNLP